MAHWGRWLICSAGMQFSISFSLTGTKDPVMSPAGIGFPIPVMKLGLLRCVLSVNCQSAHVDGPGMTHSCSSAMQDRNLVEADCVIWHSFGVTHIPRIEDWPVMPAEHVGFFLKPFGFFDANPSLDIPVGRNMSSREHGVPIAACPSCGSKTHTSRNPHPMMHIKCVPCSETVACIRAHACTPSDSCHCSPSQQAACYIGTCTHFKP